MLNDIERVLISEEEIMEKVDYSKLGDLTLEESGFLSNDSVQLKEFLFSLGMMKVADFLRYFKQNPVGKLYKRLGFVLVGESKYHYQMEKTKIKIDFRILISALLVGIVFVSGIVMLFFGIRDRRSC